MKLNFHASEFEAVANALSMVKERIAGHFFSQPEILLFI
jgi:hypothetical protein